MNVKMVSKGMIQVQSQDCFQSAHDFVCTGLRLSIRGPLIPRTKIHYGFSEESTDIRIMGILRPDRSHGVGVCLIERAAVVSLRIHVPMTQGFDQRLFYGGTVSGMRLSQRKFFPS